MNGQRLGQHFIKSTLVRLIEVNLFGHARCGNELWPASLWKANALVQPLYTLDCFIAVHQGHFALDKYQGVACWVHLLESNLYLFESIEATVHICHILLTAIVTKNEQKSINNIKVFYAVVNHENFTFSLGIKELLRDADAILNIAVERHFLIRWFLNSLYL